MEIYFKSIPKMSDFIRRLYYNYVYVMPGVAYLRRSIFFFEMRAQ